MEAGVEIIKNDSKNLHSENAKTKINSSENKKIEQSQSKISVAGNVPVMNQIKHTKQNNLKVKGQAETSIDLKQHTNVSHSVLNYKHKDTNPIESQQLSINKKNNIIIPTNEHLATKAKVNIPSKVKQNNIEKTTGISELIFKGSFNYFQLVTTELFKVIYSMISNGMA